MNDAPELTRRLTDLAATTEEDPHAWANFQCRIAQDQARGSRPAIRNRWRVVAIAAAVVLVAVMVTRTDPGRQIFTGGDDTETTPDHDVVTASTTTTLSESSTTTVPASGLPPSGPVQPTGTTTPAGSSGQQGTPPHAPGHAGATPGVEAATTTTSPQPTTPAGPTAPDGRVINVTYASPSLGLAVTAWTDPRDPSTVRTNLWMTDPYRAVTTSQLGSVLGQGCINGITFGFGSGDDQHHVASHGVVRADATEVRVVLKDGVTTVAAIGSEASPGLHVWLAKHAEGEVDHFEARAADGQILRCGP